jgi:hypothetical protein
LWSDKKQQRLLKIEENPPPADMDFINSRRVPFPAGFRK